MAKKVRKPRSQKPRTYSQTGKTAPVAGTASAAQAPTGSAQTGQAPARKPKAQPAASSKVTEADLREEYKYVVQDLRRLFVTASILLVVLVALNFIVQ